jgi:hypothetical protein
MTLTQAEERAFTAWHEAGHLAAALAFRVMPRGATILPDKGSLGRAVLADRRGAARDRGIDGWLQRLDRLGTHARAIELMAGLAAEEKAGHPRPRPFAAADLASARNLLAARLGDHVVAERELARALADARLLMARPEVWAAVTQLARELQARDVLWAGDWRRVALAAARLIHGRHLSTRELNRWPGADAVAADEDRLRAHEAQHGTARAGTLAENAKWGVVLVGFLGLLLWAGVEAQEAKVEKWRAKHQPQLQVEIQKRVTKTPLPPIPLPVESFQPIPLRVPSLTSGIHNNAEGASEPRGPVFLNRIQPSAGSGFKSY